MAKTVGRFTLTDDGTLVGPSDYMNSDAFKARMAKIEAGTCVVFNMGAVKSPDMETALLVAIQTDYAGWAGMRGFGRATR